MELSKVLEKLRSAGLEPDEEAVKYRLDMLVNKFRVPEADAVKSVVNYFLKEAGLEPVRGGGGGSSVKAKINQIKEPNKWYDIRVKVLQLVKANSEKVSQAGTFGDDTGTIRFTKWAKANLPDMQEGESYAITGVVSDEYQGKFSVKISKASSITRIPEGVDSVPLQTAEDIAVGDISEKDKWVNVKVKLVSLWEKRSDSIAQSGLVGDPSGTVKFVVWTKAGLPTMELGKSYYIKNVTTDEYQGKFSIKLNKTSVIIPLDEDIDARSGETEFTGAVVSVSERSGLIRRCPQCKQALDKGVCTSHGKVEGTHDIRVLATADDGQQALTIIMGRDVTERLIEMTMDQARKWAMEELDPDIVARKIAQLLLGNYYWFHGNQIENSILVDDFRKIETADLSQVEVLLGSA